ncbi:MULTISPECIES: GNAT family N-acetyltransferase [unclassified Paenibacillus]|uniref:GNAT family N-acetyltransferase n=1 Tax=unclassified Paenibacillus TaxID=185978 RepID=UPI0027D7BCE2|nr:MULTISPECIES: GNAT family N-acetyltransferase [unclassified Paenibacillus]
MFAISKDYRGKGYTTQAAQGIINYLFENTNIEVLNAIAIIRNIPSNRVIQKCGFDFLNMIEIKNENYNYYKLTAALLSIIIERA